jgi:hypothetical protein
MVSAPSDDAFLLLPLPAPFFCFDANNNIHYWLNYCSYWSVTCSMRHINILLVAPTFSLFVWLVADCWFILWEKYCWLVAGGWFVLRKKYCWLVADKPSEQTVFSFFCKLQGIKPSYYSMLL